MQCSKTGRCCLDLWDPTKNLLRRLLQGILRRFDGLVKCLELLFIQGIVGKTYSTKHNVYGDHSDVIIIRLSLSFQTKRGPKGVRVGPITEVPGRQEPQR